MYIHKFINLYISIQYQSSRCCQYTLSALQCDASCPFHAAIYFQALMAMMTTPCGVLPDLLVLWGHRNKKWMWMGMYFGCRCECGRGCGYGWT